MDHGCKSCYLLGGGQAKREAGENGVLGVGKEAKDMDKGDMGGGLKSAGMSGAGEIDSRGSTSAPGSADDAT